ncbi:MAG: VanZ family protein [Bacteroidota bacterium]
MSFPTKILSTIWPAALWSALIFVLLCLPGSVFPSEEVFHIPNLDKIIHIILFGCFVWLWAMYYRYNETEKKSTLIKLVILSCAYGIAMEFIQKYFIPNRSFEIRDIMADCSGAIITGIILRATKKLAPIEIGDATKTNCL